METDGFDEIRGRIERIEREDAERRGKLADLMDAQLKSELGRAKAEADGWRKIAERRLKHTDECEAALAKRNERIAKLEKQVGYLRAELANAKVLTGRERAILDMWPRFEDGKRVWFGDEYACDDGSDYGVCQIEFDDGFFTLIDNLEVRETFLTGERVKRPAPKVLDADGVEIKVGDTVWWQHEPTEYTVKGVSEGVVHLTYLGSIGTENTTVTFTHYLTHTRPDSWERLEEDALKGVCEYAGAKRRPGTIDAHTCDGCRFDEDGDGPTCEKQMALDIVRRAKALAGAEVE